MNDGNDGDNNYKEKKDRKNKINTFKKKDKIEKSTNSNIDKTGNNKKENTLVKSIENFFKKISKKFDNFAGLDDKEQNNLNDGGHDNHEPKNQREDHKNIDIDEEFINHFNIARDNYENQKNNNKKFDNIKNNNKNNTNFNRLNNNKKDLNKFKNDDKDFNSFKNDNQYFDGVKNNNKDFNSHNKNKNKFHYYKKQHEGNYKDVVDEKSSKTNFDNKKFKSDEIDNSLVFLNNLKKINGLSEDNDGFSNEDNIDFSHEDNDGFSHEDNKQVISNKEYLIKNKENREDFEIKADKTIFDKKKLNLRDLLNLNKKNFYKIKDRIVNDEETKTLFGAAIFGLILIVLISSSYYFFFYQPFQDELSTAKIAKLNELNSVYKGPLALDSEAFVLKSQIENAKSPEEVQTIDILRPATDSWRYYHNKEINIVKDDFNRVMATYSSNQTKNIITDVDSAHKIVADNDALVLANLEFKKPDTVAVPILITRLQAGAGLITVGSIVDVYTFTSYNNNYPQNSSNAENTSGNNSNNSESSPNQNTLNNNENNSSIFDEGPDISGVTVLAIMRSKDSGAIDVNYIKTKTNANGIITNQIENSESFSTDVEELLRGAIAGGFNEGVISQLLDKYGLKLSDYERRSNLAELDVQYLLLIEVPRSDVSYTINNMDNLVLTIPTENAPSWMVNELKSAYI